MAGESYWCPIEAGPFWCSSEHHDRPLRQVVLPSSYAIARFPVTNAEYRRFIEAGGYHEPRWWTGTGWDFLQAGGHPLALDEQASDITHPNHWQHPSFNDHNQPVVGVSWYEAAAYCAWLSEQGHQAGWLPAGDVLRLPTSLEWERSARHTDRRLYPWGDEAPHPAYANYNDCGLHAPTPVGCFPAGAAACGALDLAGNVWEWTATLWHQLAQPAPRADVEPHCKPAIRGGAFNWSHDYLHCGAHYWFSPGYRQNLLGFRLVWCPR
jgi:formylglycine-generating enzyme required for sulfatase activity